MRPFLATAFVRPWDARRVWLILAGFGAFFTSMVFSVTTIFFVRDVGLDPLELVLLGTAMELAAFVFEIPTGVVADGVSRRLSVWVGFAIHGSAVLAIAIWPNFGSILAAYFAIGLGGTFISGAAVAWIADEVGSEQLGPLLYRSAQLRYLGALLGIGAGVALAMLAFWIPIALGGSAIVALAAFLAWAMPETGFRGRRDPDTGRASHSFGAMAETLRSGARQVRARPVLGLLLAVSGLMGMYSEGVDRLSEPHLLLDLGFPDFAALDAIVWLGAIRALGLVLGFFGTELARRRVDPARGSQARAALLGITALEIVGTAGFALAGEFAWAVAALLVAGVARSTAGPIYETWLNQHIDSEVRATVNSMSAQMDAFGQMMGGPVVGWIGRAISLPAALLTSSLVLTPALWLYGRSLRGEDGRQG